MQMYIRACLCTFTCTCPRLQPKCTSGAGCTQQWMDICWLHVYMCVRLHNHMGVCVCVCVCACVCMMSVWHLFVQRLILCSYLCMSWCGFCPDVSGHTHNSVDRCPYVTSPSSPENEALLASLTLRPSPALGSQLPEAAESVRGRKDRRGLASAFLSSFHCSLPPATSISLGCQSIWVTDGT